MVNLTIDGQKVSVSKGVSVHAAAKMLGIKVPIFCYHDRMPPFGACRICLVQVEGMPKLQTSCTLIAEEGMVVHTQSDPAVQGRNEIMELLLINHPLDCPVCDRGGECPLQEHAVHHGCGTSRFFEEKRHFVKPVARGPVLMLDRERCIACARCTRFGELIAGDSALELINRGFRTEVGTPDGGPAQSKFIGNTIMICPVGALTSQVYRFRARPWDNETSQSCCTLCPVGCSLNLDARDGEIVRTRSREDRKVNDVWLCDKGWFGYEFSSHPARLAKPLVRTHGSLQESTWEEALTLIASKMKEARNSGKIAGFGGNPLTVEENYLFQKLIRSASGAGHVDHRIGCPIIPVDEEGIASGMETPMEECEDLSTIFLFGIDLTEEFPVLWLRLKQAINKGAKVRFAGHYAPEIARHLTEVEIHAPGEELKMIGKYASLLGESKKGAVFVGRQYLYNKSRLAILSALSSYKNLSLNILEGSCNSMGARFAGMHPELMPGGKLAERKGLNAVQVLKAAAKEGWNVLYAAGANPAHAYSSELWEPALQRIDFLVVQDIFLTETAARAHVVLPSLSFVEKSGTFLNIERRMQKLMPGKQTQEGLFSDGDIFMHIARKLEIPLTIEKEFLNALHLEQMPLERPKFQVKGGSECETGGLAASFAPCLFDHGVRMQHNEHLIGMSKEPFVRIHPEEGEKRGLQNTGMASIKINGSIIHAKVKFDSKVARRTVVLPLGFEACPFREDGSNLLNGQQVEIK